MRHSQSQTQKRQRAARGSALLEASGAISIMLCIVIPLMLYFGVVACYFIYQGQLSTIASKVALHATYRSQWLQLPRPNSPPSTSVPEEDLAQRLCKEVNVLKLLKSKITVDNSRPDAIICTCDLEAKMVFPFQGKVYGLDLASFTPPVVHAQGVASLPKVSPYATVKLDGEMITDSVSKKPFPDKRRVIAYIPSYGFTKEGETQPHRGLGMPYQGLVPNNNVSINVWPFTKESFDFMGVEYKQNASPDGKNFWPAFFHPEIGTTPQSPQSPQNPETPQTPRPPQAPTPGYRGAPRGF